MSKELVVVMMQVELDPERIDVSTVERAHATRAIALAAIKHPTSRVVAVLPIEYARLLMETAEQLGDVDGRKVFVRPPAGYRRPE